MGMERAGDKIIRSNRRSLSLSVDKEGNLVVRAPLRASDDAIEAFVLRHSDWIAKRKREALSRPKLDLSDGAELVLFGAPYRIVRLTEGRARVAADEIYLPVEGREETLARLLKKFSLKQMQELTERLAERHGFTYRNVRISSARRRWGSCNRDGTIAYSFRIAFLPSEQIGYIAVHELCHTRHFDHSPSFWREVERIFPDWKKCRKALKESYAMDYL